MKIAVIGTSNSLMKMGWVASLREMVPAGTVIDNYSIGGSASLYGSFVATRHNIGPSYDFAFLEFAINDQAILEIQQLTESYIAGSLAALLRHFAERAAQCVPIVVIMPIRDAVSHQRRDTTYNITRKLCEHYGVHYIDLYRPLRSILQNHTLDISSWFSDPMHMSISAQAALAKVARKTLDTPLPHLKPSRQLLSDAPYCFAIPEVDLVFPSATKRIVGTSLIQHEVWSIGPGDYGHIRNAPWICGIVHWADEASGALCFRSSEPQVQWAIRVFADKVRALVSKANVGAETKKRLQSRLKKAVKKKWVRRFGLTHFTTPFKAFGGTTRMRFGDLKNYPFEKHWGLPRERSLEGTRADIVGLVASDRDPVAVGELLLIKLGGAKTPPDTDLLRLDLEIEMLLLEVSCSVRAALEPP